MVPTALLATLVLGKQLVLGSGWFVDDSQALVRGTWAVLPHAGAQFLATGEGIDRWQALGTDSARLLAAGALQASFADPVLPGGPGREGDPKVTYVCDNGDSIASAGRLRPTNARYAGPPLRRA